VVGIKPGFVFSIGNAEQIGLKINLKKCLRAAESPYVSERHHRDVEPVMFSLSSIVIRHHF